MKEGYNNFIFLEMLGELLLLKTGRRQENLQHVCMQTVRLFSLKHGVIAYQS